MPIMNLMMKVPLKVAIGTSSFMVGITAIAGATVYWRHGFLDATIIAPIVIGAFAGAWLGSHLEPRIRTYWLKYIFAIVLAGIAILMIFKAVNLV